MSEAANNAAITPWGKWRVFWANSQDPDDALSAIADGRADCLGISPHKGYRDTDLSFLTKVERIEGVVLPDARRYSLDVLYQLEGLRLLVVAENKQPFNFTKFPDLEELSLHWHKGHVLPEASARIQRLYLRSYNPSSRDLQQLPAYQNLDYLELVQSGILRLAGIERLTKFEHGEFHYLTKLESIDDLTKTAVKFLHFQACKNVSDFTLLSRCRFLTGLRIINCGKLKSLGFVQDFPNLEELRFVKTVIEDGDMTPLLTLKSVGFDNKRHYSHTVEEIRQLISNQ